MVVENNRRNTWRGPLREPRDAPLVGCCGEMAELECRKPTNNMPPHVSRHPNSLREGERLSLEKCRKNVRRYDTTRQ